MELEDRHPTRESELGWRSYFHLIEPTTLCHPRDIYQS
ncbi:hypothetical protein PIIN_11531 [Serendipita indica DSM 11827]|uniref:Uncharacterized protein n=1 Tax=Serendipita indica (strain DSM 11827) TaxID=1109443 RepID=G4U1W1_SERID|nr:hypothetical protein PIIN_11531 [Serendipita indica DSM 11827]